MADNPGILSTPASQVMQSRAIEEANGGMGRRMGQELGKGLIKVGMSNLGGGFSKLFNDPNQSRVMEEFGNQIAETLQDEWWKQEAKNFKSIYGDAYLKEIQSIMEGYRASTELVPDPYHTKEVRRTGRVVGEAGEQHQPAPPKITPVQKKST